MSQDLFTDLDYESFMSDSIQKHVCESVGKSGNELPYCRVSDAVFTEYIQKYGTVLLQRAQTQKIKAQKRAATQLISQKLLIEKGIQYSSQQIAKKLQNLKTNLKQKTNKNRTGNDRINLNNTEKLLYDLLYSEENPIISNGAVFDNDSFNFDLNADDFGFNVPRSKPEETTNANRLTSISTDATICDCDKQIPSFSIDKNESKLNLQIEVLKTQLETFQKQRELCEKQIHLTEKQAKVAENQLNLIEKQQQLVDLQLKQIDTNLNYY